MELLRDLHVAYIDSLDKQQNTIEYWFSEHLRINGVYWGLTALCLLESESVFNEKDVIAFVMSCWDSRTGGFAAFPRHDAHLVTTLSALQILVTYQALDDCLTPEMIDQCVRFIKSNQLSDGSFQGDQFGEIDTRFSYTALSSLSLLRKLSPEVVEPACEFLMRCYNFDGGFGLRPGAESHAAQAFTCLGALNICGKLNLLSTQEQNEAAWWLCERQLPEGGLNGRPSKLPDVCYSWWVLSSLSILGKLHWIDQKKLREFILSCQDPKKGGFSDRPDNEVDVYHTVFSLSGLSLMGFDNLVPIDPTYCMPINITRSFAKYPYK